MQRYRAAIYCPPTRYSWWTSDDGANCPLLCRGLVIGDWAVHVRRAWHYRQASSESRTSMSMARIAVSKCLSLSASGPSEGLPISSSSVVTSSSYCWHRQHALDTGLC